MISLQDLGIVIIPTIIFFIVLFPPFLYVAIKKIFNYVPLWLPPLIAFFIISLYYSISHSALESRNDLMMMLLLLIFISLAVINPFRYFENNISVKPKWMAITFAAIFAAIFLYIFIIGGSVETISERLFPGFGFRFPLMGFIFDTLITTLHLQNTFYKSPMYEIILFLGLYLEIILISSILYYLMRKVNK